MVVERTVRRSLAGVMSTLVLSTMLAHPVAALTWVPPVGVAADTAAAWAPALVATGPQSAAAIFRETVAGAPVIRVARTIDGGASWLRATGPIASKNAIIPRAPSPSMTMRTRCLILRAP